MEETAMFSPEEALEALKDCYCEHMLRFAEANQAGGWRENLTGWLGSGVRKKARSDALNEFHQAAQALVEDLCAGLEECPEQAGRSSAAAMEIILFYPLKQGRALDLALAAIEGLAEPLVPYLEPAAAAELADRYRKRTPPRMMLPNQKALFAQIQAQAET